MTDKHIYKVVFFNQEKVYEVYVKHIYQGDMYGFIVIEDFIFGEKSALVIDPCEEKIRIEFEGIDQSFIPTHNIIRIDQVKKKGVAKIIATKKDNNGVSKVSRLYQPDNK